MERHFKKFGKLPGKPSELIDLALKDLSSVRKFKKYSVSMDTWMEKCGDTCFVCLAGAVMARTLKAKTRITYPGRVICMPNFLTKENKALLALDWFRLGNVELAFMNLRLVDAKEGRKYNRMIVDYHINPSQFFKDMKRLSADLKKDGY